MLSQKLNDNILYLKNIFCSYQPNHHPGQNSGHSVNDEVFSGYKVYCSL